MRVKAYDDISLFYLSETRKPDEVYLLSVATLPKFRLHRTVCSGPNVLPVFNEVLDRDHMWRSSDTIMISPDGKLWYHSQGR